MRYILLQVDDSGGVTTSSVLSSDKLIEVLKATAEFEDAFGQDLSALKDEIEDALSSLRDALSNAESAADDVENALED